MGQSSNSDLPGWAVIATAAQPVPLMPAQLDQLAARIALYPDPLLAPVLTASTRWNEIRDAAEWTDHLCARLAAVSFGSRHDGTRQDTAWTEQLGDAVLKQRPEAMDALQGCGRKVKKYRYLQPNAYSARPVYGLAIGGAIHFGPAITIGAAFAPWGWSRLALLWPSHAISTGLRGIALGKPRRLRSSLRALLGPPCGTAGRTS